MCKLRGRITNKYDGSGTVDRLKAEFFDYALWINDAIYSKSV